MISRKLSSCVFLLPALVLVVSAQSATIRVDHESSTNGPGTTTWSKAWTNLDDALDFAASNAGPHQIWVADGCYSPSVRTDPNDARSVTFSMLPGVRIFGGFQGISRTGGGETQLAQRNPVLYETILSGDIAIPEDATDNAYHVVTAKDVGDDSSSQLDGFIIRDGYADGENSEGTGGGLWIKGESSPVISRCVFVANYAFEAGGAVRVDGGIELLLVPTLFVDCVFRSNSSDRAGGGVAMSGAVWAHLLNCLAHDNSTGNSGGGFLYADCGGQVSTIARSTRNYTDDEDLGAMHFAQGVGCGNAGITNSIIYGNTNASGNAEQAQLSTGEISHISYVTNCDIQNLDNYSGDGNIDVEPMFVNPTGDDFRLQYLSLLLNSGDVSNLAYDEFDIDHDTDDSEALPDLDMNDRQVNSEYCIDIGAYEEQTAGTCDGDITGASGVPDGVVGTADLLLVIARWTTPGGVADLYPSPCGDGTVNTNDMLVVQNNWGNCSSFYSDPLSIEELIALLLEFAAEDESLEAAVADAIQHLLE